MVSVLGSPFRRDSLYPSLFPTFHSGELSAGPVFGKSWLSLPWGSILCSLLTFEELRKESVHIRG
jgi:hypothetical protein